MDSLAALVDLPEQATGVPFPTREWPRRQAGAPAAATDLVDQLFDEPERFGSTHAVVVVQRGELLAERYGGTIEHLDREPESVEATTKLLSWSMAKSLLHAVVGTLVRDKRLDIDAPAPVAAWHADPDDQRGTITVRNLLEMRDGLDFVEEYTVDGPSDVVEMLFGGAQNDVARFAIGKPLAHEPGSVWNYSSGTSNIISRVVGDIVGGGERGMRAFLDAELFGPLGVRDVDVRFDDAGTFLASSFVYTTAQNFARFGLLYLRDGVWDGRRILPEGWVDDARRPRSYDDDDDRWYGSHWWALNDDLGTFWANGYEGQCIFCVPSLDLIVVRLGKTPEANKRNLAAWRTGMRDAFRG
ncbi:MAG: serine hydrolase [Actinobacteria bacterium]|nr:serine hydrolase [Actinomycetota bacterium]